MLRFDFVTLFPEMIAPTFGVSMAGRAIEAGLVSMHCTNPRDFATDTHRTVDDRPFGGGPGMLLKAPIVAQAVDALPNLGGRRILVPDPRGRRFTESDARALALAPQVVFLCGHYEGIDERILEEYDAELFSVGDFVLTGGELPSLLFADAILRKIPGVLGEPESLEADSHAQGLLTGPQYTRPREWRSREVPEVLLSGDHQAVADWMRGQALNLTRRHRPDLFCQAPLAKADLDMLNS